MTTHTLEICGVDVSPHHYIGGRRIASSESFDLHSPIDQRLLGRISEGSPEHVDAAIQAAHQAFPAWAALGAEKRKAFLDRFAEEIGKRTDAFSILESNDAGVLLSRMRHGVVPRAMLNVSWFADHALHLQDRTIRTEQASHRVRHDPAGVVAIITPWNSPLMLATWKLGPALAAGNTVVIKPPEWAPLTSSLLADAADDAGLPPGVVNIVQGRGATTGARLVSDPRLARISFTGSVATAKWIAQTAGANLVSCSLELGGKSPFIVLDDADLDNAAATGALMYRNAGQVCLAGTRFLVHQRIADAFIERMRHYVERLNVGDPREEQTEVGPIIHPRQVERVKGFVDRAVAAGATVLWGGTQHPYGAQYFQPTMLSGVAQNSEIVQNEVFGPVLTLQTFDSDNEALRLANDVDYGLGGVCYGETAHAAAVAEQVRTGFIWVNSFGIRDLAAPFGGCKRSGIGREGGDWSFEFFCDVKDVIVPNQPFRASFSHR
ncbi:MULTISPECIES: aldehyde dehydrogenase family protein [Paraburkholderia]|uniref:Aldehyde dehydrogenase family protein n=1 Tax=Paraburkholderia dipogonis TaxID=1211383 RepID=A0A4Y8MGU3_9BURK|nr:MULTISPECIES: aldehyde dehydrogenase family protein [Paraburkholderia]RKR31379.1 5-carboxymethyl-2-hydroxymuconic-semialdehyde dehydrogenase [Paraburkholderia sp. BL17N1]TFE36661.1 aldehyde dehydrogenase family protein [Paraburkholderia dipogonis]